MSRELVITHAAQRDLIEVDEYISKDSPQRAEQYVDRIIVSLNPLTVFPSMGTDRGDIRDGLRTFGFERRVLIAYTHDEDHVYILRIFYGGRDVEAGLAPLF